MGFLNFRFDPADWVVFGAMLAISFIIAVINGIVMRRKSNSEEFLMGSRAIPLVPTAMSLMSSFISSITILGYPADVYVLGLQYMFTPIGWMLGGVLILLFIVPLLYPLGMTSVYEYFERRYQSKAVRRICAFVGVFQQTLYIGVCVFGPATALEAMIGFESWKSVLIISFLATVPTAIGGLKGVIWMDFFQGVVMYGAMIAILIAGSDAIGGFYNATAPFNKYNTKINSKNGLVSFTWYGALFGNAFTWLGHMGFSQTGFQRYGALKNLTYSRVAVFLGLFIQATVVTLAFLCGLVVFGYFSGRGCDPISSGLLNSVNHLVPAIVQEVLHYPGVPGLFMASVVSGAYSSMTSSLTAIGANLWEDALKNSLDHKGDWVHVVAIRSIIVITGLVGMAVAFGCIFAGGSIIQLALAFINASSGPLVGAFILSALFPWVNVPGVVCGTLSALLLTLWMGIGAFVHVVSSQTQAPVANVTCSILAFNQTFLNTTTTPNAPTTSPNLDPLYSFYEVSYLWYGIMATAVCICIGLLVSLLTRPCVKSPSVEKRYLFPMVRGCGCAAIVDNHEQEFDRKQ